MNTFWCILMHCREMFGLNYGILVYCRKQLLGLNLGILVYFKIKYENII